MPPPILFFLFFFFKKNINYIVGSLFRDNIADSASVLSF